MTDTAIEPEVLEVPEFDEELEALLIQSIEQAQERMGDGEDIAPFTAVIAGQSVFEETHAGTTEECFASARDAVLNVAGGRAYAFCYDGYIDTDEGEKDAIIAEGGVAGEPEGVAVGLMYEVAEDGSLAFGDEVVYIAEAENYLADAEPAEVNDDEAEDSE